MSTKHTPGLMTSKHHRAGHDVTVDVNANVLFCRTCKHHILSDAEAAAPDLLNALTTLADAAESRGIPCDAARAAIAKAGAK